MTEGESLSGLLLAYGGSFGLGVLLGMAFLWGLWLTVRRLPTTRHPALLMLASLMLRFGLTLAGFLIIARYGSWEYLLAAAVGFTLPRLLIGQRLQHATAREEPPA